MSRPRRSSNVSQDRFPRVSGDEPTFLVDGRPRQLFSPRERG